LPVSRIHVSKRVLVVAEMRCYDVTKPESLDIAAVW
jgi:hypothetical protein